MGSDRCPGRKICRGIRLPPRTRIRNGVSVPVSVVLESYCPVSADYAVAECADGIVIILYGSTVVHDFVHRTVYIVMRLCGNASCRLGFVQIAVGV